MTSLSAAQRSQMYTELQEATSPMTAEALMQGTVDVHWGDLATKDDFARLEANMATKDELARLEASMATKDELARLETKFEAKMVTTDQLHSTIDRALRRQTIWFISTMVAFNGLLATWFSAFH